jgi:hypothetical protein
MQYGIQERTVEKTKTTAAENNKNKQKTSNFL